MSPPSFLLSLFLPPTSGPLERCTVYLCISICTSDKEIVFITIQLVYCNVPTVMQYQYQHCCLLNCFNRKSMCVLSVNVLGTVYDVVKQSEVFFKLQKIKPLCIIYSKCKGTVLYLQRTGYSVRNTMYKMSDVLWSLLCMQCIVVRKAQSVVYCVLCSTCNLTMSKYVVIVQYIQVGWVIFWNFGLANLTK